MLVTVERKQESKNRDGEFLEFDLVFVGYININPDFYLTSFIDCFQKVDYQKKNIT